MNPDLDLELIASIHEAVGMAVKAAGGPLPSMFSPEFVTAPVEVRIAVLAVGGSSYVFARDVLDSWLDDDYDCDGQFHRHNALPAVTELMRRRWPPTGDRATWVKYGPAGPPPDLAVVA